MLALLLQSYTIITQVGIEKFVNLNQNYIKHQLINQKVMPDIVLSNILLNELLTSNISTFISEQQQQISVSFTGIQMLLNFEFSVSQQSFPYLFLSGTGKIQLENTLAFLQGYFSQQSPFIIIPTLSKLSVESLTISTKSTLDYIINPLLNALSTSLKNSINNEINQEIASQFLAILNGVISSINFTSISSNMTSFHTWEKPIFKDRYILVSDTITICKFSCLSDISSTQLFLLENDIQYGISLNIIENSISVQQYQVYDIKIKNTGVFIDFNILGVRKLIKFSVQAVLTDLETLQFFLQEESQTTPNGYSAIIIPLTSFPQAFGVAEIQCVYFSSGVHCGGDIFESEI